MYTLTLANGEIIRFYVRTCAEIFQQCYGGELTYKEKEFGDTVEIY